MKKAKIIVFILMLMSGLLPLIGVIVPWLMGRERGSVVGIIGSADGPTSIFVAGKFTPDIVTTFIPTVVLFIVWVILHIISIKKKEENV